MSIVSACRRIGDKRRGNHTNEAELKLSPTDSGPFHAQTPIRRYNAFRSFQEIFSSPLAPMEWSLWWRLFLM